MAAPKKIRIMISSRCNDDISFQNKKSNLTAVRKALKAQLESEKLLGSPIFDVWINEDATSPDSTKDAWDACMTEVKKADIVIVLYNGDAGWTERDGDIGICHAELLTSMHDSPSKVRVIALLQDKLPATPKDKAFQEYYSKLNLFRQTARDGEEVIGESFRLIRETVAELAHLGVRETRKGKYSTGQALDWSKLDFLERSEKIVRAIQSFVSTSLKGEVVEDNGVVAKLNRVKLLFMCHAAPASMSVASARELVGRPFAKDHTRTSNLKSDVFGPIHLIGCHRTVSETQALNMLGYPEAFVVSPPSGVYVVDPIYSTQLVFINNCRDESMTVIGLQRLFDWIQQTGEEKAIIDRAKRRTKVLRAIAQ